MPLLQGRGQQYWGKFSRGQYLNVILNAESTTDDVPVVKYWREGTDEVDQESVPFVKSRDTTFYLARFLGEEFTDGNYAAVIQYEIDATEYVAVGYFQVQGGEGTAPVIGLLEIDRSLGRAVVMQRADNTVYLGYRPRRRP